MKRDELAGALLDSEREALSALESKIGGDDDQAIYTWFAALPRRVGRRRLQGGIWEAAEARPLLNSFRACDLAAALLLADAPEVDLLRLYRQGDSEERRMILKALPLQSDLAPDLACELMVEAHRTNDQLIFEAGVLDSELPAQRLSEADYNNAVLKTAFIDADLGRLPGALDRGNPALSAMLLDFMAEREAAGRSVWAPSLEIAARAPVAGVIAKIRGDLWSGVDARRAAATAGAIHLKGEMRAELEERAAVEPHPKIAAAIKAALSS